MEKKFEEKSTKQEENEFAKIFSDLYSTDVSNMIETKKSGSSELNYLSWAKAWALVMSYYPCASYEIIKFKDANGDLTLPFQYLNGLGYMVYVEVTIRGFTRKMHLPVMNYDNQAMLNEPYKYTYGKYEKTCTKATMMDINKTIMRCLVKCIALFGLGLKVFEGEDLYRCDDASVTHNTANSAHYDATGSKYCTMAQINYFKKLYNENEVMELCRRNNITNINQFTAKQMSSYIDARKGGYN